MDSSIQYALPAESVTVTPIDPNGRYLVTVKIADDLTVADFEQHVLTAFRELGVPAGSVRFIYVQGAPIVYTQEVKEPEPVKGKHRG